MNKHRHMLVHTSPFVIQHQRMAGLIQAWLLEHKDELLNSHGEAYAKMQGVFNEENTQVPLECGIESLDDVFLHLPFVLDALEVVVENGESIDRLDYTKEPKIYIVVGGTVLARGLTLEGLSVSFFLRMSLQYDTLLQMGRWFGYRHGYEDLPRLWTTADLAANFRALARIEEEIREDISNYRKHNVTPAEFAVRVRSIPGMAITAASKMRHAYRSNISFEGRHIQTIRFDHKSELKVHGNWKAAVDFVNRVEKGYGWLRGSKRSLARGVLLDDVRSFLAAYDISSHHMDLKKDLLLGYLEKAGEDLQVWNVGLITPAGDKKTDEPLGCFGSVNAGRRSQLKENKNTYADIKALMSRTDILIDVDDAQSVNPKDGWSVIKENRPEVPLLLLYVIDGESKAGHASTTRKDLDAVGDLIGIGIVFPGKPDRAGGFYSVELDAGSTEQLELDEQFFVDAYEDGFDE